MEITRIKLKNFRSHNNYSTPLSSTTIITGPNGSGKTSIIEAVYIALRGNSFRGSLSEILNNNEMWWRADVETSIPYTVTIKFNPAGQHVKQFIIKDKQTYKLPNNNKYPVVLFEPDDMRLIHGSPERRRTFIDKFISQIDPGFYTSLKKYERALKQRNTLLKSNSPQDSIFVWDVALSEYGADIITKRQNYIEKINQKLQEIYRSIAKNKDEVFISYSTPSSQTTQQQLLNQLHANIDRDRLMKSTSTGPHRHDILFGFNGASAKQVTSRGEARTIVLALKLIEAFLIEEETGKKPIILLDDVLSELDEVHQRALQNIFKNHYQTIITGTHVSWPQKDATVISLS